MKTRHRYPFRRGFSEVVLSWASRVFLVAFVASLHCPAQNATEVLCAFDSPGDLAQWQVRSGKAAIVSTPLGEGGPALRLEFDPAGQYQPGYLFWQDVPRDWSAYDALLLTVINPADEPLAGYLLVADETWEDQGRSYWNRHNSSTVFPPGVTEWTIPVRGLFRGEAGSRNNDIPRNIDPDRIVRLDFGFGRKGQSGVVFLRNLRFVKASRPEDVHAFDFGPPSQSTMLGWTPVNHATEYSAERGYGWGPTGGHPWDGAARDTTFGPDLTRDFCEARNYSFRVDVTPGEYVVFFILENSGYWGGEQAKHAWRRLRINGRQVWEDTRSDGPAHALFRFEDVEPVGIDLWETYMLPELTEPVSLQVSTENPYLDVSFDADVPWACKLSALAVHRAGDAGAEAWLGAQLTELARDFRRKAASLDPPPTPAALPQAWRNKRLVAWTCDLDDVITPHTVPAAPPATPEELRFADALAARGETEPLCLAIRPAADLGECALSVEGELGPNVSVTPAVVWYNTSRGFNSIAYRIRPHTLRQGDTVRLDKDLTRQIILTVTVGPDAQPGEHEGALAVHRPDGSLLLRVPFTLTVSPVLLNRDTDYLMGFFGLMPPGLLGNDRRWEVLEQTLVMLRKHGMNAVSGGPSWRLTGWQNGQPQIDFGDCERFFALLRKHGFTKSINGYGGLRFAGLHDRYTKGATAERVARESGLDYDEAFRRAWRAFDQHAREKNWPTIFYAMCDETRVREKAEREFEFMTLMRDVTQEFHETVQASGSYSVSFQRRSQDPDDMLYWHQEFFRVLDISSLNLHDPSVMAQAERLDKTIHIYNQGRTRYSFGLYQWSESRKGVKARWQWHLNILHGYQFFDLDGREPDTAMICYGRDTIYPTIHFERCREGAEDFYLYNTLEQLAARERQRQGNTVDVRRAEQFLQQQADAVRLNQRNPPEVYDPHALKRQALQLCESLIGEP